MVRGEKGQPENTSSLLGKRLSRQVIPVGKINEDIYSHFILILVDAAGLEVENIATIENISGCSSDI